MNYLEKIRACSSADLPELARAITDDRSELPRVVVGLARSGSMEDSMRIAELLSFAAIDGTQNDDIYSDGRNSAGKRYAELFLSCCRACNYPESEYIGVFINALNSPTGSALYGWSGVAEEYLTRCAEEDFDLAATYIDRFDKTYSSYSVLLAVDRSRALGVLLGKVLYGRFIDKTAVRSILVGCPDITDALISAYDGMSAKERAAAVRLLQAHKDDPSVDAFLTERAALDKSKTVLKEVSRSAERNASKSGGAVKYFESLMSAGESVKYGTLCELIGLTEKPTKSAKSTKSAKTANNTTNAKSSKYGEVAEKIFFYTIDESDFDAKRVMCYDGKKFFDMSGRNVKLVNDDDVWVLHPLDLERNDPLLGLDIDQPFLQLRRPIYEPTAGERMCSKRFFGTFVTDGDFAARMKRYGFEQCESEEGNKPCALRIMGKYAVGAEYDGRSCMCENVFYYSAADIVRHGRRVFVSGSPLDITELDVMTYSELTYSVAMLFAAV